jgi:hypothetical protein
MSGVEELGVGEDERKMEIGGQGHEEGVGCHGESGSPGIQGFDIVAVTAQHNTVQQLFNYSVHKRRPKYVA